MLEKYNVEVLRTDLFADVYVIADGEKVWQKISFTF